MLILLFQFARGKQGGKQNNVVVVIVVAVVVVVVVVVVVAAVVSVLFSLQNGNKEKNIIKKHLCFLKKNHCCVHIFSKF